MGDERSTLPYRSIYPVFKDARAIFDERVWASVFSGP